MERVGGWAGSAILAGVGAILLAAAVASVARDSDDPGNRDAAEAGVSLAIPAAILGIAAFAVMPSPKTGNVPAVLPTAVAGAGLGLLGLTFLLVGIIWQGSDPPDTAGFWYLLGYLGVASGAAAIFRAGVLIRRTNAGGGGRTAPTRTPSTRKAGR